MGMFDNIRYESKFPWREFQTKDTPSQGLDLYEIREDGTLWLHDYDTKWIDEPDHLFKGYIEQYNYRWVFQESFTGEIVFYDYNTKAGFWDEYSGYFVRGKLENFQIIHERKPI